VNWRLHLWFSSVYYPKELAAQRQRGGRWIRWSETTLAVLLAIGAAAVVQVRPVVAIILVTMAVGLFIALTVIEPTTTRVAFGRAKTPRGSRPPRSGGRRRG
jgi:hypothetical protein